MRTDFQCLWYRSSAGSEVTGYGFLYDLCMLFPCFFYDRTYAGSLSVNFPNIITE